MADMNLFSSFSNILINLPTRNIQVSVLVFPIHLQPEEHFWKKEFSFFSIQYQNITFAVSFGKKPWAPPLWDQFHPSEEDCWLYN